MVLPGQQQRRPAGAGHVPYAPTHMLRKVRYWHSVWCDRVLAMSGTEIAYGAMRSPVLRWRMVLCEVRY
eukprot:1444198-Rhodomonas_salina.1